MLQSLWLSMLFQELTMLKNKLKTNIYLDNLLRQAMILGMTCVYGIVFLILVDGWYSDYDIADTIHVLPGGLLGRILCMIVLSEISMLFADLLYCLIRKHRHKVLVLMSVVISQAILNFIICNLIATWYEKILSDNDIYWRFMFTDFVVVSIASLMYIVLQYSVRYKKERELRILTEINEEKVNNALLREKLEKLSNQADTHFIFNCLGTLQELVREKSDQTEQFITSFTNMYRYMLDAGRQRQTTLEDELIFLEHYSYLVHVRYPEVEISVDYEKGMLKEGYTFPMTIQTLVKNAIKHNAHSRTNILKIQVDIKGHSIIVTNNLIPMSSTKESTGVGLENLKERFALLTHKELKITRTADMYSVSVPILYLEDIDYECLDN